MSQDERRRDVRVRLSLPVKRIRRGLVEPMEAVEGSYRGLLLKMPSTPCLGELMKLQIQLPERLICVHAVPVRYATRAGAIVVGCMIFALHGPDQEDWRNHIGGLVRGRARAA